MEQDADNERNDRPRLQDAPYQPIGTTLHGARHRLIQEISGRSYEKIHDKRVNFRILGDIHPRKDFQEYQNAADDKRQQTGHQLHEGRINAVFPGAAHDDARQGPDQPDQYQCQNTNQHIRRQNEPFSAPPPLHNGPLPIVPLRNHDT